MGYIRKNHTFSKDKADFPSVSIITVSYKEDKYLHNLLRSLEKLEYPESKLEIIIVSILSTNKDLKLNKILLKNISINHKVGYSEAVNTGIHQSSGQYLFLPNPDTAVDKLALKKMVEYLGSHKNVGIVGPKVFSMDNPGVISPNDLPCKNFNKMTGKVFQVTANELAKVNFPREFYWICGNGILLRRFIWEQVKRYDENYFLYWEDSDFSMKVRSIGYKSVIVPDAKMLHKGSASVGVNDDQVYYIVRNGRLFINKYSNVFGKLNLHFTNVLVLISKSIQLLLSINDRKNTKAFIDGILDFYKGRRGVRI